MEPYQELEECFARWSNLPQEGMVACSSGTAALHLALEAFKLPQGSRVVVPDFTMIACARAVILAGLTPAFIDCDDHLLIDPGAVQDYLRTLKDTSPAVVMPVHVYGRRCDMGALMQIISKRSGATFIVEDLAEAHGIQPNQGADAACWSFYKNKIIAGEEGGAVWFRNPSHVSLARQLRSLGFTPAHDMMHIPRGHNYRMGNVHAGLVLKSLASYNTNMYAPEGTRLPPGRRAIEQWYEAACPPTWRMPPRDAPWVYDFRVPGMTNLQQDELVTAIQQETSLAVRHGFKSMLSQSEFAGMGCNTKACDKSRAASREIVYLPLTSGVRRDQATEAFAVARQILR